MKLFYILVNVLTTAVLFFTIFSTTLVYYTQIENNLYIYCAIPVLTTTISLVVLNLFKDNNKYINFLKKINFAILTSVLYISERHYFLHEENLHLLMMGILAIFAIIYIARIIISDTMRNFEITHRQLNEYDFENSRYAR